MAVSAYAALVSLTHVLDNLHYRAQFHYPRADLKQVEMLQENVHFLLEFVEGHSESKNPELKGLWRQMVEVAAEADNTIHFHVVNQLLKRSLKGTLEADFSTFCEVMETLIQKFFCIKKKLPVITEEEDARVLIRRSHALNPVGGSSTVSSSVKEVVGIDEHVARIMDQLTRGKPNLQIFSITGMGGIGKTTLAKSVYDHPCIVEHFDLRIWLTISQEYDIEQILKDLLNEEETRTTRESLHELGKRLYKKLFGRSYLIIMDDVWTLEVWDDLKKFFPNNETSSRIMLTTRLTRVAASIGSQDSYPMNFLDEDKSWHLFCQNTFGEIGCTDADLEEIGKNIAKSCRGLPLESVVIGHLLAKNMTRNYWKFVAKNISSLGNLEDDEHCLKILSLSYESLPIHLKPCFLFMRTFREDAWISVPNLIGSWIAEGFIKQQSDKSLEETANEYVKDLIDRNLIFSWSTEKCRILNLLPETKSGIHSLLGEKKCGIHDLLRDLCLRESNNEHFIRFPNVEIISPGKNRTCNLCGKATEYLNEVHFPPVHVSILSSKARYYVCDACLTVYSHVRNPILVKVMEATKGQPVMQSTKLRFFSTHFQGRGKSTYHSILHLFWNLQFLIITNSGDLYLPCQILEMPQLRHIRVPLGCCLNSPLVSNIFGGDFMVLKSLQTLSKVLDVWFIKEFLDLVPNLRSLKIEYTRDYLPRQLTRCLCNLAQLQKLESLCLRASGFRKATFPNSLKKLHLYNYRMAWEDMSILGSLPILECLKLCGGMEGSEWNPVEEEFLRLKRLLIRYTNLVRWRAEPTHFPVLEWLELQGLDMLEEIPLGIGDIPTLQSIRLDYCSDSAVDSTKRIWEEQQSYGNEGLHIHVTDSVAQYQIDSVTAGMTAAAYRSLVHLKNILKRLQAILNRMQLNTKQKETVEECIHFLRDIVEVDYESKCQEMEHLSREIVDAASATAGCWLDSDNGLARTISNIALIKEKLLVGKEETQSEQKESRNLSTSCQTLLKFITKVKAKKWKICRGK